MLCRILGNLQFPLCAVVLQGEEFTLLRVYQFRGAEVLGAFLAEV